MFTLNRVNINAMGFCPSFCSFMNCTLGMPCTQCAHSAEFWMSANTRTLVSAHFHKFLVPYQGFF